MATKFIVVLFFVAIIWNLGAALYYMMKDRGGSDRTVKALTWRVGLSVALLGLIILGIVTGVIQPHGIGG